MIKPEDYLEIEALLKAKGYSEVITAEPTNAKKYAKGNELIKICIPCGFIVREINGEVQRRTHINPTSDPMVIIRDFIDRI